MIDEHDGIELRNVFIILSSYQRKVCDVSLKIFCLRSYLQQKRSIKIFHLEVKLNLVVSREIMRLKSNHPLESQIQD